LGSVQSVFEYFSPDDFGIGKVLMSRRHSIMIGHRLITVYDQHRCESPVVRSIGYSPQIVFSGGVDADRDLDYRTQKSLELGRMEASRMFSGFMSTHLRGIL
jgi:hypothetical protein